MNDTPSQTIHITTQVVYKPRRVPPFQNAVLEWTPDDRVRLTVYEDGADPRVVADAPVTDIKTFTVFQGVLQLKIGSASYLLEVKNWVEAEGAAGVPGDDTSLTHVDSSENLATLAVWTNQLRARHIAVKALGLKWMIGVMVILAAVIIAGAFILDALVG